MKSGMRSIGLNAYATTIVATIFAPSGVRGSERQNQSVRTCAFSSRAHALSVPSTAASGRVRLRGFARRRPASELCPGDAGHRDGGAADLEPGERLAEGEPGHHTGDGWHEVH